MATDIGAAPGPVLSGRKALITGGGSGLGLQIARALGAAGAALVLASRKEEQLHRARQELQGNGIPTDIAVQDVARPDSIRSLMEHPSTGGAPLDILVNCAAERRIGTCSAIP
jgi:NAD(P)-dependent dehydrogenase (short-subunit alcohol dehydrogenase family)